MPIIRYKIRSDSIIYSDSFRSYNAKHLRINHSEKFAEQKNHINGIVNFWNQAKRYLRKFNGVPKNKFNLFLKECEFAILVFPAKMLPRNIASVFRGSMIFSSGGAKLEALLPKRTNVEPNSNLLLTKPKFANSLPIITMRRWKNFMQCCRTRTKLPSSRFTTFSYG